MQSSAVVTIQSCNKCDVCGKECSSKSDLNAHLMSHTDKKPFECKFCEKIFGFLSHLKNHERMHTGEKPYKCQFCPKAFKQSGGKYSHERIHTGEKPFKCQFCPNAFNKVGDKINHERIHTGEKPFQCEICSKAFKQHAHLKGHKLRVHSKIRRFKCEICEKGFYFINELNRHEKVHTNEKSLQCEDCQKVFTSSGARINRTILCQGCTELNGKGRRKEEASELLFVEPPHLDGFPDDGKDETRFIDTAKDPLEFCVCHEHSKVSMEKSIDAINPKSKPF